MKISVIVPFLNKERYIRKTIHSLTGQKGPHPACEFIFVDNGSSDASVSIVKQFSELRLIHEPKRGAFHAMNLGVAAAQGDVLAFTDADCAVPEDWLRRIADAVSRGVDIVVGDLAFAPENSSFLHFFESYEQAKNRFVFRNLPHEYYFAAAGNMAARASIFRSAGPFFTGPVAGDTEWLQRAMTLKPTPAICHLSGLAVCVLDIKSSRRWLRKLFKYGKNNRRIANSGCSFKTLGYRSRFQIAKNCIHEKRYKGLRLVYFIGCLFLGMCAYFAGSLASKNG